MKHGRKIIICNKCYKEKLHFGLGLCSACLRNHKRRTRPSFYLGTCYSEMSRRCKTYDPSRPRYFGFEKCDKKDFINKFIEDEEFLKLFKLWQTNNYERKFSPSIDRINNEEGYLLHNLRFIQHNENAKKDWQYKTKVSNISICFIFESQLKASQFLNCHPSELCVKINNGSGVCYINGFKIERLDA